jgi:CBS domain-containing protein
MDAEDTPTTCRSTDRLSEVARLMWEHDCGCLLVVSDEPAPRVVGLITDRDICMTAYFEAKDLDSLQVRDAMASELETFRFQDPCLVAKSEMEHAGPARLTLVDQRGHVAALVTLFPHVSGGAVHWERQES